VLEHLKRTEASGSTRGATTRTSSPGRAALVDREGAPDLRPHPFAPAYRVLERPQTAGTPAMLFDLIKCHAALWFLQREGEETDGETRIEATRQDFDAAARLYGAINQEGGGAGVEDDQERSGRHSSPIRPDGLETFTVRMLQQADRAVLPTRPPGDPARLHREGHDLLRLLEKWPCRQRW